MTTRPTPPGDGKREALASILTAHPGNTCTVQCARIRAALSRSIASGLMYRASTSSSAGTRRRNARVGSCFMSASATL